MKIAAQVELIEHQNVGIDYEERTRYEISRSIANHLVENYNHISKEIKTRDEYRGDVVRYTYEINVIRDSNLIELNKTLNLMESNANSIRDYVSLELLGTIRSLINE